MIIVKKVSLSFLFILLFTVCHETAHGLRGRVLHLNDEVYKEVMETDDGRFYEIGIIAQYKNRDVAKEILTEVELDPDHKKVIRARGSYEISENGQLRQVAMMRKIIDGKILPRTRSIGDKTYIGLVFYRLNDVATFSGKELTLHGFKDGTGIWKDAEGRLYAVEPKQQDGEAEYSLRRIKHQ